MNKYISKELNEMLKDKKVIIVGNAGYLQGKNNGALIDSFDIVVRMNFGITNIIKEDFGSKTDLLYNYLSDEMFTNEEYIQDLLKAKVKRIISVYHSYKAISFINILDNRITHELIDKNFFESIKKTMYKAPQTGTNAITHLLLSDLKQLNVIGFDYYKSGVYEGYRGLYGDEAKNVKINETDHNINAQIKYLFNLYLRDNRLVFDDEMKKLIGSIDNV